MEEKYIVCIPFGGFNDKMNVIWKCYQYAITYNRILVIDTQRTNAFFEDIREYLYFKPENIYKGDLNSLYTSIKDYSIFPREYNIVSKSNTNIRINLSINYNEKIIVFANCGGGERLIDTFNLCSFAPFILNVFKERYKSLPKGYISVHIRNTDMKSDIKKFLNTHINLLKDKSIFLGTDHAPTILEFKSLFKDNLYSFAEIPDNKGNSIHHRNQGSKQRSFNIDCIVDLLLLASGSKIYYPSLFSGYTRAALALHKEQSILKRLTEQ